LGEAMSGSCRTYRRRRVRDRIRIGLWEFRGYFEEGTGRNRLGSGASMVEGNSSFETAWKTIGCACAPEAVAGRAGVLVYAGMTLTSARRVDRVDRGGDAS